MPESDTDSALLTPSQRDVLRDEAEISPRGERSARTRVRKRIRIGILEDFPLILGSIEPDSVLEESNRAELAAPLRCTVAFVYRLAEAGGLDPERIIQEGVTQGQTGRGDMLLEQFREAPSSLRVSEIEFLLENGLIDVAERNEALGLPVPEHISSDSTEATTTESDEDLDEYGTGVQDTPGDGSSR